MKIKINVGIIFCLLVIIAGIAYYILWNMKYDAWGDIGIYSVTVFFVAFGVLGLAYSILKAEQGKI